MIKYILVPLDGSRLAEAVLPVAEYLALKLSASIILVHVIEQNAPEEIHGERHLRNADEAKAYLQEIANKALASDISIDTHVHTSEVSNVPKSIVEHVGEYKPDLIVMCAHGRGGLRDILVGSIAQQVIGNSSTPVLLIQSQPKEISTFSIRRILTPLDGDPAHEQGLRIADELAHACSAALNLLVVVPTIGTLQPETAVTGRLLPGTMKALLNYSEQESEEYLARQIKRLSKRDYPVNHTVLRGDPALAIANYAKEIQAELILLGTHGKAGTEAFWSGSVAPKLPGLTNLPLLFVPVS